MRISFKSLRVRAEQLANGARPVVRLPENADNYLFTSGSPDAISIPQDQRRFFGPARKPPKRTGRCEEESGWDDEVKERCERPSGHDGIHTYGKA